MARLTLTDRERNIIRQGLLACVLQFLMVGLAINLFSPEPSCPVVQIERVR